MQLRTLKRTAIYFDVKNDGKLRSAFGAHLD